ncbi:MAG: hypothetical protein AAF127_16230 [Pseudomonadota bacterium]
MRLRLTALAALLALGTAPVLTAPAAAQSTSSEVAKDGSCPKGFKASGSSCKSSSYVAITKIGSCPTGFKAYGNYCVGDKGDYAEVKSGSCKSPLKASGKYCIK